VSYNYLKKARSIKNSSLCRYDSLDGFTTNFNSNGNVDGWTMYDNIYMYGCWSGILFGSSYERECYIGRSDVFSYLPAEDFYLIYIMMKLTVHEANSSAGKFPTKGKVRWITVADTVWDSNKELEFDLINDDKWHLYTINMGPASFWQGNINNIRVYPFIDGRNKDSFAIKYIKVSSKDSFSCTNTSCSYYESYVHNCPGVGQKGYCESGIGMGFYSTVSDVNDALLVNINGYGDEIVRLGTNNNISGADIAKKISNALSKISIGGYAYSEVEFTEFNTIKIISGSSRADSLVVVRDNPAAETLGFFDSDGIDISIKESGIDPASGFDYAASRKLQAFEINKLAMDLDYPVFYLNPAQYVVEGGRRDFEESTTANIGEGTHTDIDTYDQLYNNGQTIVDMSHPISDSGRLTKIYVNGTVVSGDEVLVYIIRPLKNGTFTVIKEFLIVSSIDAVYTTRHVTYRIDCNELVDKGDVIGLYNINPTVPYSSYFRKPNATYYQFDGRPYDRSFSREVINAANTAHSLTLNYDTSVVVDTLGSAENIQYCLNFDGTSDYSSIAAHSDFSFKNSNFTVEFWAKVYVHRNNNGLFGYGGTSYDWSTSTGYQYLLYLNSSGDLAWQCNGGSIVLSVSNKFSINTWHHVAVVNDNELNKFRIFVDGKIVIERAVINITQTTTPTKFTIGSYTDLRYPMKGRMFGFNISVGIARYKAAFDEGLSYQLSNVDQYTKFLMTTSVPVFGNFDPGPLNTPGILGFCIYARGDRRQTGALLDIDLGNRVNINTAYLSGKELEDTFEFNIASCLDIGWQVDLYGHNHMHVITYSLQPASVAYHNNIAYGLGCLDDGIVTADNGRQGDSYSNAGANGVETVGSHAYFYVNGDAEWVYQSVCDGKHEFCTPATGASTSEFENDPISFFLLFPNNVFVDIHKSIIYFKEAHNFRSMSLSYYLGPGHGVGNANIPTAGFQYVPNYTSIAIDGISYEAPGFYEFLLEYQGKNDYLKEYLFRNPSYEVAPEWDDGIIVNGGLLKAQYLTQWNIIEHNFNPVTCNGFCIHTDYHKSTKITEMELYSKLYIEPTLIDNIFMRFSDYGDYWKTADFESDPVYNTKIFSKIGAAPRFINVEVSSQVESEIYGLCLYTSDDIKLEDCNSSILLTGTKTGGLGDINKVEFENGYDKPYDLIVDLPVDIYEGRQLLSWMKLGSEDEVLYPEIGPGGIIRKNKDCDILNRDFLVSINCPTYGLINLAAGKKVYVKEDYENWSYYSVIGTDGSLNYTPADGFRETIITFSPTSDDFIKVKVTGGETYVSSLYCTSITGNRVDIKNVFYDSDPDYTSQSNRAFHTKGGDISKPLLYNTDTSAYIDLDWVADSSEYDEFVVVNNNIIITNPQVFPFLAKVSTVFVPILNFEFSLDFFMCADSTNSSYATADFIVYFKDSNNINILTINYKDASAVNSNIVQYVTDKFGTFLLNADPVTINKADRNTIHVTRSGNTLVYSLNGGTEYSGYFAPSNYISKVLIEVSTSSSSTYHYDYHIINCPILNDSKALGIELGAGSSINTITFKHYNDPSNLSDANYIINTFEIYTSSDNGDNYIKWSDADIRKLNGPHDVCVAIDLEKRHNLDFIRNYGTLSDKLDLRLNSSMQYSTTSDIDVNNVVWGGMYKTLYLTFNDGDYRDYSKNEIEVTTLNNGGLHLVSSPAIDNYSVFFSSPDSSRLTIPHSDYGDLFRIRGDFTIDWWQYHATTPQENVSAITFSTENLRPNGFTNMRLGYYNGGNIYMYLGQAGSGSINTGPISYNIWVHYAITRHGNYFYGFRDGVLKNSWYEVANLDVGEDSPYYFMLGGYNHGWYFFWPDYWSYFTGSLARIRFVNGQALWTTDFDIGGLTYADPLPGPNDTRWVNFINVAVGGSNKIINKIGIYPDISVPYSLGGTYNSDWEYLGNKVSNYDTEQINVALNASVSGSSSVVIDNGEYTISWSPSNVVNGIHTEYGYSNCWGFMSSDTTPTLDIDLGDTYTIDTVVIYHGIGNDVSYLVTDYIIEISTTISGSFTEVVSVSDNDAFVAYHRFSPAEARRVRVTISDYISGSDYITIDSLGTTVLIDGGFLREVQVLSVAGGGEVSSEDYPIICVDLREQFNVVSHSVINTRWVKSWMSAPYMDALWDNNEQYFKYSNNVTDDPKKITFVSKTLDAFVYYSSVDSFTYTSDTTTYTFSSSEYLEEGFYNVSWQAYNVTDYNLISLRLYNGSDVIDLFADTFSDDVWASQLSTLTINRSCNYSVLGVLHKEIDGNWGVKLPSISASFSEGIKWVSIKKDTATGYSYDRVSENYGPDYIDKLLIYGDVIYNPTEYSWWWRSNISELSNDYMEVVEGRRALNIDYPTSSGIDFVEIIEAYPLINDVSWSEMDMLSFWLYIEDVNRLDMSFGTIGFGNKKGAYYLWQLKDIVLESGWNKVKLYFDNYTAVVPIPNNFLDSSLNFRNKEIPSFGIMYRGVGEAFSLKLDTIKIERNRFETDVKFGKGLCLTWNECLDIPISDLTLTQGSIEFWVKLYCDYQGQDVFGATMSRTLFTLISNNNEVISLGIKGSEWFEIGVGGAKTNYNFLNALDVEEIPDKFFVERKEPVHLAMVWSNDGSHSDSGATVCLYMNGELVIFSKTTWEIENCKSACLRLGGGNTVLAYNSDSEGSGIFDNLKLYNYCKTSFNINKEDIDKDIKISVNEFLKISKDGNNFYGVYDGQLPLVYEGVPVGEKAVLYIRTNKDSRFKQSKNTADLMVSWLVTV